MPKVLGRILCPVDFDQGSAAAVDFACKLAELDDGVIYLLHVVSAPRVNNVLLGAPHPILTEAVAKNELQKVADRQLPANIKRRLIVRTGDPAALIVAVADQIGAHLIVLATHSGRDLTRLIFGSVVERVIHETTRPVLNIRPH